MKRVNDLAEVGGVWGSVGNLGGVVHAGPLIVGREVAFPATAMFRGQLGLSGLAYSESDKRPAAGVVWPISRMNQRSIGSAFFKTSNWTRGGDYSTQYPAYGSIGLELGFIVGLGAQFDVVQLVDFFGGLFGADLLGDDDPYGPLPPAVPEEEAPSESEE